ncbi:MAG: hypothetical protein K0U38_09140 [Epsilonproteobacteria bacterium]|nr:hypothetical protein [Campylobacterota bacterium]
MNRMVEEIIKECFWEYNFTENEILLLAKSENEKERAFLFSKILANSKQLLKSMKVFDKDVLKQLIESYSVPSFNHDYMARRINMLEYYFLNKPLTINELKWTA